MNNSITLIITGVSTIVIGLVIATTIFASVDRMAEEALPASEDYLTFADGTALPGQEPPVDEYAGVQGIGDLIPLIYIAVVLILGIGLMAVGGKRILVGVPEDPSVLEVRQEMALEDNKDNIMPRMPKLSFRRSRYYAPRAASRPSQAAGNTRPRIDEALFDRGEPVPKAPKHEWWEDT